MIFSQICSRVFEYQQTHNANQFQQELTMMQQRLERAQTWFQDNINVRHHESGGRHRFIIFWRQKSEEERLEMIQKVANWLGLMRGADWCGIRSDEWLCLPANTTTTKINDNNFSASASTNTFRFNKQEGAKIKATTFFHELCVEFCMDTELITHLEDYCFERHDTQYVKQQILDQFPHIDQSTNKKQRRSLITLLATFKRFIAYFVVNGLIVLYQALEKAKFAKNQNNVSSSDLSNNNINNNNTSQQEEQHNKLSVVDDVQMKHQTTEVNNHNNNNSSHINHDGSSNSSSNDEVYLRNHHQNSITNNSSDNDDEDDDDDDDGEDESEQQLLNECFDDDNNDDHDTDHERTDANNDENHHESDSNSDNDENEEGENDDDEYEVPDAFTIQQISILKREGKRYEEQKRFEDALRSYSLALALLPTPKQQKSRQRRQQQQQKLSESNGSAMEHHLRSPVDIRIEQERTFLHLKRATLFFEMKSYREVLSDTRAVLESNTNDLDCHLLQILAWDALGDQAQVIALCKSALQLPQINSNVAVRDKVLEIQAGSLERRKTRA